MNFIEKIIETFGNRKNVSILDYGCGSGALVDRLRDNGYENTFGIDINPNKNRFCQSYNGKKLPYHNGSWDCIISNQVLEHCFYINEYYCEASRVLKKDGVMFCHFPHRLSPRGSHFGAWLIHWFPKVLRKFLYPIVNRNPETVEKYLNWKWISYHKKIASHYFYIIDNRKKKHRFLYILAQADFTLTKKE